MVCEKCLGLIQHQKDWLPAGAVDPGRLFSFVFNKDAIQSASQPLNKTFHHHQLARDLKAAAEDGCYFCSSFWDMITAEEKDRLIGTDPSEAPASDNGGSDSFVTMCVFLDVRVMMDQIGASAGDFLGLDPRSFVWSIRITRPDFVVSADRLTSMFLALPVYGNMLQHRLFSTPLKIKDASLTIGKTLRLNNSLLHRLLLESRTRHGAWPRNGSGTALQTMSSADRCGLQGGTRQDWSRSTAWAVETRV